MVSMRIGAQGGFDDAGGFVGNRRDCGADCCGHWWQVLGEWTPECLLLSVKPVFLDQSADLLLGNLSLPATGPYSATRRVLASAAGGNRPVPVVEFLTTQIPLTKILSPTVWADVWAFYSLYDGSYTDRRTYGFNIDIANGFFTLVPTLVLYAAFTVAFLPAHVAGILGVMLFWQWEYATSVYLVSFYVAERHKLISRADAAMYIWGSNATWLLFPLLGLYISIRLIVDGDYSVLGYR